MYFRMTQVDHGRPGYGYQNHSLCGDMVLKKSLLGHPVAANRLGH